jgi:hypothetical protein
MMKLEEYLSGQRLDLEEIKVESREDYEELQNLAGDLEAIDIDTKALFELAEDWETRPTVAAKRLLTSLAIVLSVVAVLGLDYSNINFLWIKDLSSSQAEGLSIIFGLLLGLSLLSFLVNLRTDLKLKAAKITFIADEVTRAESIVKTMREMVGADSLAGKFLSHTTEDGKKESFNFDNPIGKNYRTVEFFHDEIGKPNLWRIWLKIAEYLLIFGVTVAAFYGLIRYWIGGG